MNIDNKNIGILKYCYFLLLKKCFCYKNNKVFKYLDLRTKILSEEFLYELYFEKHSENFNKCNELYESKENLAVIPDIENMEKFHIQQKIRINNS